ILGEAVRDRDVLALDIAGIFEALAESAQKVPDRFGRLHVEKPDDRHRRLLRARRERPRRRTAEERDEVATFHSITSSARASNVAGISRPSTFAGVRLTTRSNLIGCSIGISAGLAPRRILSTRSAARRNRSGVFAP